MDSIVSNKTYLFIDESGDHGLTKINNEFPVFSLSGVLTSEKDYAEIISKMNELKLKIWGHEKIILHSRDIRKCDNEFFVLLDLATKNNFYTHLNKIIIKSPFTVVASCIRKDRFIKKYGRLNNDIYEIALSFVIEKALISLKETNSNLNLHIIIEKRGRKEDKQLQDHFQRLLGKGTSKISPEEIAYYKPKFTFSNKNENINGLQLADLLAYPIARHVVNPSKTNDAFEVLKPKIFNKGGRLIGLKVFP